MSARYDFASDNTAPEAPTFARLQASGWFVYRFVDGSVRFMCSWATTAESADSVLESLKSLA